MQVAAYDANGPIHAETANDAVSVHVQPLHHCVNCGSDELIAKLQATIRRLRERGREEIIDLWNGGLAFASAPNAIEYRKGRDEELAEYDAETERLCRGEGT